MKTLVTKQEWIDALTKAKAIALTQYPSPWCIFDGCNCAFPNYNAWAEACFDKSGEYQNDSVDWVSDKKPSRAEVAAVFDNSIQLIKEM